jgi:AcrR family transcriptional regulator
MNDIINHEKTTNQTSKPRGRPVSFNQDEVLEKVLQVFWTHGYEGTAMSEIVEVLGINKPSIYTAFGNKEALFQKALEKYIAGPVAFIKLAFNEPTAKQVAERFLTGAADFFSDKTHPDGCMVVQGALSCGKNAELIKKMLISHRQQLEQSFRNRFELAKTQGDLPENVESGDLAKYLITLHQGMSVQSTSGASKDELLGVIQIALNNFPTVR